MSSLWSPQMRKWVKDARQHGMNLHMERRRAKNIKDAEFCGGNPYTARLTDNGGLRIIDSPSGIYGNQPRNIDRPT